MIGSQWLGIDWHWLGQDVPRMCPCTSSAHASSQFQATSATPEKDPNGGLVEESSQNGPKSSGAASSYQSIASKPRPSRAFYQGNVWKNMW